MVKNKLGFEREFDDRLRDSSAIALSVNLKMFKRAGLGQEDIATMMTACVIALEFCGLCHCR